MELTLIGIVTFLVGAILMKLVSKFFTDKKDAENAVKLDVQGKITEMIESFKSVEKIMHSIETSLAVMAAENKNFEKDIQSNLEKINSLFKRVEELNNRLTKIEK